MIARFDAGAVIGPLLFLVGGTGALLAGDAIRRRISPVIDRRRSRPPRGLIFRAFFAFCLTLLVIWLGAGIAPYFADRSTDWHAALHRAGGALREHTITVVNHELERALEQSPDRLPPVDPALAVFDKIEISVHAERPTTLLLDNTTADPHSIAIYADRRFTRPVFIGRPVQGSRRSDFDDTGRRISDERHQTPAPAPGYRITLVDPGTYWYRCGIHEGMTVGGVDAGRILALAPEIGPTHQRIRAPTWAPWQLAQLTAAESHRAQNGWTVAADYAFSMLNLVLAVVLMRLRPRDRVARLFALGMLATAAAYNLQSHSAPAIAPMMAQIHPGIIHPLSGLAYVYALLTFPDGGLVPRWRDHRVRMAYAVATFFAVVVLLDLVRVTRPAPQVGHAVNFLQFFGVLVPLVGFTAQGYRLSRAETAEARQQSRLLLYALAPVFAVGITLVCLDATIGLDDTLVFRAFQPVFALIPIALFIGIVRYRLWDIDLVVNKTILYGSLAAFIGAVYVGLVVGIGGALPVEANALIQVVTMVVVAVAFEPVREWARRLANRLVYGERASPYEVMADFSRRLGGAFSVEEALPRTAEAAGRGLGAAHVRVRVRVMLGDGGERTAEWPVGVAADRHDRTIEVSFRGETIGEIAVAKLPGESLSGAEERLLGALAGQAGVAFHNTRLSHQLRLQLAAISAQASELAASRGRILSTQVSERRRLEEEITEAIAAPLAQIVRRLDDAGRALPRRRREAVGLLDAVTATSVAVQERLRDISRGVFPPLLSDKGLVAALEGQVRMLDIPATLDGQETLQGLRFDPEAEAAVYFCCVQAIRGAAREGGPVQASLSFDGSTVTFSVAHHGPPPEDLANLSDRVEALGGSLDIRSATGRGTTITGRVPAGPVEQRALT